jgi:hypothetical protein
VATSAQRAQLGFTGRYRRSLVQSDKTNFAPRLGISWRPTKSDKLIVHTGFGMFYDLGQSDGQSGSYTNAVFSPETSFITSTGAPPVLTNGVLATTENVFGSASIPPLIDQFLWYYNEPGSAWKTPRYQMWSFGIESQLTPNLALEIDYVGTHGVHLEDCPYWNQPLPGVGPVQPRRPFPDLPLTTTTTWDANSNYNALQTKLTKRLSHELTFLVSYTYGKSLDETEGNEGATGGTGNLSYQNAWDRAADYGRSYTDVRQRFVYSYVWQLPVGRGRRFLDRGGILDHVLGGWELSGIFSATSGPPMTILAPEDFSNTGSSNPRPDRTCSGVGPKTLSEWFDTSCFTDTYLQQALNNGTPRFGNAGRNILDAPGLVNWDSALLKEFRLTERFGLQFRGEFFDFLNHANFGYPGTVLETQGFGVITSAASPRDIQFALKLTY